MRAADRLRGRRGGEVAPTSRAAPRRFGEDPAPLPAAGAEPGTASGETTSGSREPREILKGWQQ